MSTSCYRSGQRHAIDDNHDNLAEVTHRTITAIFASFYQLDKFVHNYASEWAVAGLP